MSEHPFMCTFTYPYMNGRLHIGHAMTIVNTDIAARFHKQQGQEVLFPFGFHCTGMPIYASAMKLKYGDQDTHQSLLDMGIPESEMHRFHDPMHWVKTFPQLAVDDLKGLNLCCDFKRSFVTTDINPYYDSFVKWQYRRLHDLRCLKYMDRPCIYSIKDGQPCADHDRRTGEGIKPVEYQLCYKDNVFYIRSLGVKIESKGHTEAEVTNTVTGACYKGIMPEHWKLCLGHQNAGQSVAVAAGDLEFTGISLYLPEGDAKVISRTGDRCIVAEVSQWYITYSDPEWRRQVVDTINKMTIHDPELLKQLVIAAENMDDWCVSREYGLGTRLPNDPKFLIDSLSDSTIYMAYYTVCHLLHKDLYGHDQIIPADQVDDRFWDEVLLGKAVPYGSGSGIPTETIQEARSQFLKWYPPQLRVAGKDLIYNHLTMSIFQHIKLFGPEVYCKEYHVNGYAKLNDKKMSKSTGNFITLHDALIQYPRVDALRVLMIESGDGLRDANIRLKNYTCTCEALDSLKHSLTHKPSTGDQADPSGKLYYKMIVYCMWMAHNAFNSGKYREALTYGWRKCDKVLTAYKKYSAKSAQKHIIKLGLEVQAFTVGVIVGEDTQCPLFPEPELGLELELEQHAKYYELVQSILKMFGSKSKSKKTGSQLQIHEKLRKHEEDLKSHISSFTGNVVTIVYDCSELHPKRDPYRLKPILL